MTASTLKRRAYALSMLSLLAVVVLGVVFMHEHNSLSSYPPSRVHIQGNILGSDGTGLYGPAPGAGVELEAEGLEEMARYWHERVTYPTGRFDPAWINQAEAQDRLVQRDVPAGNVIYNRSESHSPLTLDPTRFTSLGPAPLNWFVGQTSGRVNAIAVDPTLHNVAYLGVAGGGVWKSTDCCSPDTTWLPTTDTPNIAGTGIGDVTVDPNNHNVVYAGTGDLNFTLPEYSANGILKSTDAGATWAVLGASTFSPPYPGPPVPTSTATPPPACGLYWRLQPSPIIGTNGDYLSGVAVVSSDDVWAAGTYINDQNIARTHILHYTNGEWTPLSSPNVGTDNNLLSAITAISSNDIWAVGHYSNGSVDQTLILHYTGGQWVVVPSPNPGSSGNFLYAVTALSSNDIWAVGAYPNGGAEGNTLTLHYTNGQWTVVSSPNAGPGFNSLYGVAAVSANDIWAVGTHIVQGVPAAEYNLVLHYTNGQWAVVPSPSSGTFYDHLTGVAVVSANDIWAVGARCCSTPIQNLTLHYSDPCIVGTPTATPTPPTPTPCGPLGWSRVVNPTPAGGGGDLYGVTVAGPNDVWAVGASSNYPYQTLIEHWNGREWSIVPSPNASDTEPNVLKDVDASGPTDVWAVGYYGNSPVYTLIEHWDGTAWNIVPSPSSSTLNYLNAVEVIAPNDVWAVGQDSTGGPALIEHWDGTAWSISPIAAQDYLYDIAGTSPTDVWAAGTYMYHWDGSSWTSFVRPVDLLTLHGVATLAFHGVATLTQNNAWAVGSHFFICGVGCNYHRPSIIHWDGIDWTEVPNPVDQTNSDLQSVVALASDDIWAVGNLWPADYSSSRMLILHWDGVTWTEVAAPSPGANQEYLRRLAAKGPAKLWAVGGGIDDVTGPHQVLTVQYDELPAFTDVAPGSTFYPYIRCLACRGILGGYDDGTFRPGVDVTRGQIAKIVSNAAGFNEDPNPQIFEDVPADNPFYTWINRLSRRGHMGGYPCGTIPEEPCIEPDNRPYFRPFANATRAQLAKIVSNAAGFADTPPEQIFTDVPPDNGFYLWVQRLASRGIMGGYPCGGEGEPCDAQNRPYFRPYNNVTRGQTAKIVANTFFPDCHTR